MGQLDFFNKIGGIDKLVQFAKDLLRSFYDPNFMYQIPRRSKYATNLDFHTWQ